MPCSPPQWLPRMPSASGKARRPGPCCGACGCLPVLERLELAARAEVKGLLNPRSDCSVDELLFATVAWDLGLDGDAVSASGR